jgi:hypothetical protein
MAAGRGGRNTHSRKLRLGGALPTVRNSSHGLHGMRSTPTSSTIPSGLQTPPCTPAPITDSGTAQGPVLLAQAIEAEVIR